MPIPCRSLGDAIASLPEMWFSISALALLSNDCFLFFDVFFFCPPPVLTFIIAVIKAGACSLVTVIMTAAAAAAAADSCYINATLTSIDEIDIEVCAAERTGFHDYSTLCRTLIKSRCLIYTATELCKCLL